MLEGCTRLKDSPHELYTSLEGQRRILGRCGSLKDSAHELYTSLDGLR